LIIQLMKLLVALGFLAIFASLGSALFFMMRDGRNGRAKTSNMARALAFRVGFSILLFVCILAAWKLGYIRPTGLPLNR
jgi:cytochrome bd-type quinol oxidase subunit 2